MVWMISQSCSVYKYENCAKSSRNTKKTRSNVGRAQTSSRSRVRHEYARPTNDWCFKHIFGITLSEEGNQNEFTSDLLNSLLELSGDNMIKEVSFRDPVLHTRTEMERSFITDIHCVDNTGKRFIIEMQVYHHHGWEKRIQAYVARDYGSQIAKGDDYRELFPVHILAITQFDMFPEHIRYLSHHAYAERETKECFFEDTQITVLELPKFRKAISEIVDQKDRWAFLLKNAELISHMREEEKTPLTSNPLIERVCRRIDQMNWNEQEMAEYEAAEDNRKVAFGSLESAKDRGISEEKTRNREKRKITRKLTIGILVESNIEDANIKEICAQDSDYDEAEVDNIRTFAFLIKSCIWITP
ncbi:hypothetical protein CCPUN_05520 [Cardinium endosymbiont of Culicoides punctatus]|nr:hypothetical protein CCPUN_05520 [Cardinium endosymbiont of Culicoides punctatus]